MKKSKGFTLIELLVVIAIIGILAAIVLVSLGGARDRAQDARIIADMNQIRTTAELEFSTDNDYDDIGCGGTVIDKAACANCLMPSMVTLCEDLFDQGGTNVVIHDNGTGDGTDAKAYCAEVELNVPSGNFWCVDSNLISKSYPSTDPPAPPACSAVPGSEVYLCE